MASCISQNLFCAAAHMAYSAAGSAFWWVPIGKLTKASRTFPLSTYSRRMIMSAESCHILQYGHWKSLAMIIQTFAAGLPRIRALSALATRGSFAASASAGAFAEAGAAASGVADAVFAPASSAPLQAIVNNTRASARADMVEEVGGA